MVPLTVKTEFTSPESFYNACKNAQGGLASQLFANLKDLQVKIVGFYLDKDDSVKQYKSNGVTYCAVRLTDESKTGWLSLLKFGAALSKCPDNVRNTFLKFEEGVVQWNIDPTKLFFMSFDKDGNIEKVSLTSSNGASTTQPSGSM